MLSLVLLTAHALAAPFSPQAVNGWHAQIYDGGCIMTDVRDFTHAASLKGMRHEGDLVTVIAVGTVEQEVPDRDAVAWGATQRQRIDYAVGEDVPGEHWTFQVRAFEYVDAHHMRVIDTLDLSPGEARRVAGGQPLRFFTEDGEPAGLFQLQGAGQAFALMERCLESL